VVGGVKERALVQGGERGECHPQNAVNWGAAEGSGDGRCGAEVLVGGFKAGNGNEVL
jgi:hypothetical protein